MQFPISIRSSINSIPRNESRYSVLCTPYTTLPCRAQSRPDPPASWRFDRDREGGAINSGPCMAGKPLAADDWRRADVVGWFVSWKRKLIGRYWDPSGFDLLILVPASTMAKSLALALLALPYLLHRYRYCTSVLGIIIV